MAKLERVITGNFDEVLSRLEDAVLNGSVSASLEDRVALSLTLAGNGDQLYLTAITAGGSQAMFFKINTWGEESFLDTLASVVGQL